MKLRRVVLLMLCALLVLQPGLAGAQKRIGGFAENVISLPSGYETFTDPAVKPDGSLVMAGKKLDTGTWELLTWKEVTQAPTVTPLAVEGADLTSIDVAPDGFIMGVSNDMMSMISGGQPIGGTPDGKVGGDGAIGDNSNPAAEPEDGEAEADATTSDGTFFSSSSSSTTTSGVRTFGGIDNIKSTVYWFNEDGSIDKQFDVQGMLMSVKAASGQRLVGSAMQSGLEIYNSDGKIVQNISASSVNTFCVTDTSLLYIEFMGGGKLYEINLETGETVRTVSLPASNSQQIACAPDGTVYVVNSLGVQKIGAGETEAVQIMENPTDYLIGNPDNGISGLGVLADGTLILKIEEGSGGSGYGGTGTSIMRFGGSSGDTDNIKLVNYIYKADLDLSNRTPFTITALQGNSLLRKAVSEFQQIHPELIVTLQTLIPDNDTETPVDDAVRTLNTDLLAGKGGDVLMLDSMPVNKYIEKGVLMDLTDALADIGFVPGILEGSKAADGKLYAMPTFFTTQSIWGHQDTISGVNTLEDLFNIPLDQGQTIMNPRTPESWLRMFFPASESAFRDDAGKLKFDTPEFEAFLECLYELYSTQGVLQESETGGGNRSRFSMEDMQSVLNGAVALFPSEISGTMQLPLAYSITGKEESGLVIAPSVDGPGTSFTPSMLAGVNAQSQNKDMAIEFIKSLYTHDMQSVQQVGGMPVVAASLDTLVEEGKERARESESGNTMMTMMMAVGGGTPLELQQPNEQTWDDVRALIDTLNTSTTIDEVLMGFIVEETASFFEGYKSAQEAADAVQQRAWSYLNE